MGAFFMMLTKIFKIPEAVRQFIEDQVKKKRDKASDQASKDLNKQFNDINGPDPKKPAEPDKEDIGKALADAIEEAMSARVQISAEMQQSINRLRGFAPDTIDYPSDTDALVKQYMSENGGKSNASIDTLRNTGYLMQGQQQIGQAVQLTGQAIAGMAQNMDQSFQGAMEFMQQVPEAMNDAMERQEDGLEDFLKEWRRGQDKQFKFFSFLKSAALKPFEIAKIGMSAAEKAQATFKMVKESVEQALGKGAAIKVIFKQLADAFPFIGKIRDKIIDFENLIPNLTEYMGRTFKHLSGKISSLSFSIKGAILSGLTGIEFAHIGDKIKDKLSQQDQELVKDYNAINASKQLNQAISDRVNLADSWINSIESRYEGELSEETKEKLRAGDTSTLDEEVRRISMEADKKRLAWKELGQFVEELKKTDSSTYHAFDQNPEIRDKLITYVSDYVSIKDQDPKDKNNRKALKIRSKRLRDYIGELLENNKDLPQDDPRVAIIKQLKDTLHQAGDSFLTQFTEEQMHSELEVVHDELAAANAKVQEKMDAEDVEAREAALKKYNFMINERGQIDTAEKKPDWVEIRDENRELVKKGSAELQRIMGGPNFGNARANQFVKDMLLKYQLPWNDDPEFINTFFNIEEDNGTVKSISINDYNMTKWLEKHPKIGYTTYHENADGQRILSEEDKLNVFTNRGEYSNYKGTELRIRNQGSNAWREFEDDGSASEQPVHNTTEATKAAPTLPSPSGGVIDAESVKAESPTEKAVVLETPTSTPTATDIPETAVENKAETVEEKREAEEAHTVAEDLKDSIEEVQSPDTTQTKADKPNVSDATGTEFARDIFKKYGIEDEAYDKLIKEVGYAPSKDIADAIVYQMTRAEDAGFTVNLPEVFEYCRKHPKSFSLGRHTNLYWRAINCLNQLQGWREDTIEDRDDYQKALKDNKRASETNESKLDLNRIAHDNTEDILDNYVSSIETFRQAAGLEADDAYTELLTLAKHERNENGEVVFLKDEKGNYIAIQEGREEELKQAATQYRIWKSLVEGRFTAENSSAHSGMRFYVKEAKSAHHELIALDKEKQDLIDQGESLQKQNGDIKKKLDDIEQELAAIAVLIHPSAPSVNVTNNTYNESTPERPREERMEEYAGGGDDD